MPGLVEKIAYCKPIKHGKKQNIIFKPTYLDIPELNQKIQMDEIQVPKQLSTKEYVILYSHGNAENLNIQHQFLSDISKIFQCPIVSYDYLGYGSNQGTPSEKSTNIIVLKVYEYVKNKFPTKKIIIWGRSIGSAPSIYLASKKPVDYLIVQSGLATGIQTITSSNCLCKCIDHFMNIQYIKDVKCKILIMHGTNDIVIPYRCSLVLLDSYINSINARNDVKEYYDSKTQNKVITCRNITHVTIQDADHNDVDTIYEDILFNAVVSFIGEDFQDCNRENKYLRSIKHQAYTLSDLIV